MRGMGELWRGMIAGRSWRSAVRAHRDGTLTPEGASAPHWGAAGMFDADGELTVGWRGALEAYADPKVAGIILARHRDALFRTELAVGDGRAVTVLSRSLVHPVTRRSLAPLPTVEVATAPRSDLWQLLRRVLPREQLWRAAPSRVASRPVRFSPPSDWPEPPRAEAVVQWVGEVESSHPVLRAARDAHAEVTVVLGDGEAGGSQQASWFSDGTTLYRGTAEELSEVPPGDVGQWLTTRVDEFAH